MLKQYLRKRAVAERYQTTKRTIDRMADDGRIPPPALYNGRVPLWDAAELDEADRRVAIAQSRRRPAARDELSP